MKSILIMAGGTGGHIFPALAVAKVLAKKPSKIVWLGAREGMENNIIPQHKDICLELIPMKAIRGNGITVKIILPWMLLKSCYLTYKIIKKHNIVATVGFGAFISIPGGIVSYLKKIPIFLHEQNATLGLANKILSKLSIENFYAFPGVFKNPDGFLGNPVRAEIENIASPEIRFKNRTGPLKVLVMGGSLGAKVFNETLPIVFAKIAPAKRPIIIHQCGNAKSQIVQKLYDKFEVVAQCFDFLGDIAKYYAQVDFVICRAGALTIAELISVGLGGILVPFPFATDDHQTKNAQYLLQNQAIDLIDQKDFSIDSLVEKISLLKREHCLVWAHNAHKLAKKGTATKIANIINKRISNEG